MKFRKTVLSLITLSCAYVSFAQAGEIYRLPPGAEVEAVINGEKMTITCGGVSEAPKRKCFIVTHYYSNYIYVEVGTRDARKEVNAFYMGLFSTQTARQEAYSTCQKMLNDGHVSAIEWLSD